MCLQKIAFYRPRGVVVLRIIFLLLEAEWVRAEYPDNPTSPRQRCIITEACARLLTFQRQYSGNT